MLWAAALVACSGSTESPPTDSTPTDTTGSTGETGQPPETGDTGGPDLTAPEPDLDALAASLQATVRALPTITMRPCYQAWHDVSQDQDACPAYFEVGTTFAWEDSCHTRQGTQYDGILTTTFDQTAFIDEYLYTQVMVAHGPEVVPGWQGSSPTEFTGEALEGVGMDGTVDVFLLGSRDPDFTFGGQGLSTTVVENGLQLRYNYMEGLCTARTGTAGTWMGPGGVSPWIHIDQLSAEGGHAYRTHVDGSMSGLPEPYSSASWEDVVMRPAAVGGTCDLEPTGSIQVRHTDGYLYDVAFDAAACDGCGEVTSDGHPFGTVCVDFSALLGPMAETDISDLLPAGLPESSTRSSPAGLHSSPPALASPSVQELSP